MADAQTTPRTTTSNCLFFLLVLCSSLACWAIKIPCAPNPGVDVPGVGRLRVLEDELTVDYYLKTLAVYEYEALDFVNILITDASVTFTGLLPHETQETRALNFYEFPLRIEGVARLNRSAESFRLRDCDIYFVRNFSEQGSPGAGRMPQALVAELLREANLCVRQQLCADIGQVGLDALNNAARQPHDFGFLAVSRLTRDAVGADRAENRALQLAVNKLIDLAIEETTAQIRAKERRFVPLPDVERRLLGRRTFSATGGLFGDVSTLRRIEDAVVGNVGQRFTVSLGFGLDDALIYFKEYTIHNILRPVRGELKGQVTGIAIKVDLTLDFERRPCQALLEELRITRAGDMRVNLTGLGPFNRLLSGMGSWFARLWKRQVVAIVERNVRGTLQKIMDGFECEALRP